MSGRSVEDRSHKIGPGTGQAFTAGVVSRLNLQPLVTTQRDYPITVELEARGAPCYVRQGDATVTVGAAADTARMATNTWRVITVASAGDAFVAVAGDGGAGTLTGVRVNKV